MSDTQLKLLKHQRGQLKAELTRFEKFLDTASAINDIENIQCRAAEIENILNRFRTSQTQIEELYLKDFPADFDECDADKEREMFENRYYAALSASKKIISSVQQSLPTTADTGSRGFSNAPPSEVSNIKLSAQALLPSVTARLPQLRLPEFSGSYSNWQSFLDTFNALVHDNKTLSNVEKFYYLQASLKGEPANIIASLPISDSNYTTAWDLLIQRYDNKRVIINSHLREIINLQCSSKESHSALRNFSNMFLKNFRSLESLGENVHEWSTILIFILVEKLDFNSRKEWETFAKEIPYPNIGDFNKFLSQRCQVLEALDNKPFQNSSKLRGNFVGLEISDNPRKKCPVCTEPHFIYYCDKFKALSIDSRFEEVKRLRLCSNCLRYGHHKSVCRSSGCKICNQRHATLLHRTASSFRDQTNSVKLNSVSTNQHTSKSTSEDSSLDHNQENVLTSQEFQSEIDPHNHTVLSTYHTNNSLILLSTAVVNACGKNDKVLPCRVLLDSGSQSHFVSRSFANKLQLDADKIDIPIIGINQIKTNITERVNITISSRHSAFKADLVCLVIPSICDNVPLNSFDINKLNIPSHLLLADPDFNNSSDVDMLLGCGLFFELLCSGQLKLGKNLPVVQETLLGWVVAGAIPNAISSKINYNTSRNCFFTYETTTVSLDKFWTIEEVTSTVDTSMSQEELECETHFQKSIHRTESGRFVVSLPLKDNFRDLGNSEETAYNRFYALERRLSRSPELALAYNSFINEYIQLGHMSEISRESTPNFPTYYLPHHSVERPDSATTKVRVVFDASCKTTTGVSLNDVLKVGPTIQSDLFSILLRFRQHNFVFIADLAKMYRQILVQDQQRSLQRIVWRSSPSAEIKHYELNTVTYGTASASFLSTRCLKQIAIDNTILFPRESEIIASDFYVDDLLTGAEDLNELLIIRQNLCSLLSQYGFDLRKFQSNDVNVLNDLNLTLLDNSEYIISDDSSTKTLGVSWIPSRDVFEYNSNNVGQIGGKITKRTILSFISKIFDPLGLLGPLAIRAKIIIQKLWILQLNWDDTLPNSVRSDWEKLEKEISQVGLIQIPRHILLKGSKDIQIHGFSDASELAYACCIYTRSVNKDGRIESHLVCAKSRVAPLKSISLPRLELCGCLILSRLLSKVLSALTLNINSIILWSDSQVALSWIKKNLGLGNHSLRIAYLKFNALLILIHGIIFPLNVTLQTLSRAELSSLICLNPTFGGMGLHSCAFLRKNGLKCLGYQILKTFQRREKLFYSFPPINDFISLNRFPPLINW